MGTRSYALGIPSAGSVTQAQADIVALQSSKADISYVDMVAAGFDPKASVKAIALSNITLSGTQTIDGVSCGVGDSVLVAGQSTGSQNGIYVVASGAWARRNDANADAEVTAGLYTFVAQGTLYASTGWALVTADPILVGTTALTFTQVLGKATVNGPSSSVDNAVARFDGTTGRLLQGGTNAPSYDDSGNIVMASLATVDGRDVSVDGATLDIHTTSIAANAAAIALKADATYAIRAQINTTDTLVLADAGKLITESNASAITQTVPPNSSVAFPIGTQISFAVIGAGQVTFAQGAGVTINPPPGFTLKSRTGTGVPFLTLVKYLTDTWVLTGDVAAV